VGNYCSAPIIADTRDDTLHYQSSYYYIGHFSRFIRPGAVRVLCATTRDELEATAFLNPDGQLAVVVLNRSGQSVPFALKLGGAAALTESSSHSITTYISRRRDETCKATPSDRPRASRRT
jgi:glucosylceramidase